ncbi:MAG: hypothetical protein SVX43_07335 [Cyanobacteriota bacterium]|nr:hypothetical protein [Cyanobacteriota bacterium]
MSVLSEQVCLNIAENSEEDIADVIAYLRFHKLTSKSSTPPNLDDPGRLDVIPKNCPIPQELNDWINDAGKRWRRGNDDALRESLQNLPDYKKIKEDIRKSSFQYWMRLAIQRLAAPLTVTLFIVIYLWLEKKQDIGDLILVLIPLIYTIISEIFKEQ